MTAKPPKPFWEASYARDDDTFGDPSDEVLEIAEKLPSSARVLDAGCGDGRNAIPLAEAGLSVDAVDVSVAGIERLTRKATERALTIRAWVADLRSFAPVRRYDLIVCHGVLHLLQPSDRDALLGRLMAATRPGGWNVAVAFNDRLPAPPDLAPFSRGPFAEGELASRYAGWDVERAESYVLEDEHPGGVRHRHSIDKVVARRPGVGTRPRPPREPAGPPLSCWTGRGSDSRPTGRCCYRSIHGRRNYRS